MTLHSGCFRCGVRGHSARHCLGRKHLSEYHRRFVKYAPDGQLTRKRFSYPGFGFYFNGTTMENFDYQVLELKQPTEAWQLVHPSWQEGALRKSIDWTA